MSRFILFVLPLILPTYVVRFQIGPIPTTLLEVIVLAMFAAWVGQKVLSSQLSLRATSYLAPLALWLVAGLVGVIVAPDHIGALGLWRAYFLEPALVFVMLSDLLKTDDDRRTLLTGLALAVIGVAVWAVIQYITGYGIPKPWNAPPAGIRATGPFPFPNAPALFAVPAAALFLALAIRVKREWIHPALAWIAAASGGLAALLAKSDGGMVALAAAGFVALVMKKRTRIPAIIAATLIAVTVIAIPTTRDVAYRQFFFKEWSGKVRLVMWGETIAMLKDRPIFGAGLGAYPDVIRPYHKATWMEIFQYPHNILLNLWSELGLLGIIAFTWILIVWIRFGTRHLALPVIAAILVHGLVDVPYFKNDLAIMFWMLVAVTQQQAVTSESVRALRRT